jgi:hypothetical protein
MGFEPLEIDISPGKMVVFSRVYWDIKWGWRQSDVTMINKVMCGDV